MEYKTDKSRLVFDNLKKYLAGGISSDVRLGGIDPYPLVVAKGKGARFWDVDENEYIDFGLGFGPLILGHSHPAVVEAVTRQLQDGSHFGAPTEAEYRVAKRMTELVPGLELVRFNQSGTEANLSALRIARAYTGRTKFIKFEGGYHGWMDSMFISHLPPVTMDIGPREAPNKIIQYEGQAASALEDIIILTWNDLEAVEKVVKEQGDQIAAIITEPILGNAGVIMPKPGYLEGLRKITQENGIVLIFDEVVTGFRLGLGGAQEYFGVIPDLSTFAKAMGAGYPVSAVGGKAEIMNTVAERRTIHAGTYNGNSLVLAAVEATLNELSRDNGAAYKRIAACAKQWRDGLTEIFQRRDIPFYTQGADTVFGMSIAEGPIYDYRDSLKADPDRLMKFRSEMRKRGVYTKPSPRDIVYISAVHTPEDIAQALEIAEEASKHI